jgi:hypothetical protein
MDECGIACPELHFWRQRDERSIDPYSTTVDVAVPSSWTEQMYLCAMNRTIKDTKDISILPTSALRPGYNSVNCMHFFYEMQNDNVAFNKMMCGLPCHVEGADATVA